MRQPLMGEGERSLCLQAGGCRDSGDPGERGDPAEVTGGVLARDDIMEDVESKDGEEGVGGGRSLKREHSRGC